MQRTLPIARSSRWHRIPPIRVIRMISSKNHQCSLWTALQRRHSVCRRRSPRCHIVRHRNVCHNRACHHRARRRMRHRALHRVRIHARRPPRMFLHQQKCHVNDSHVAQGGSGSNGACTTRLPASPLRHNLFQKISDCHIGFRLQLLRRTIWWEMWRYGSLWHRGP